MVPPQLLILTTTVYRARTASAVRRSVTRDIRSTQSGDERHDQHTMNTLGAVDPDQEGIGIGTYILNRSWSGVRPKEGSHEHDADA